MKIGDLVTFKKTRPIVVPHGVKPESIGLVLKVFRENGLLWVLWDGAIERLHHDSKYLEVINENR